MRNRRLILTGCFLLAGLAGGFAEAAAQRITASELQDGDIDTLRKMFNEDEGIPRLILLLSPT